MAEKFGVTVRADSGPGVLHQLTGVIAKRRGDISTVEIIGQAGVMTVMATADTAKFSVDQLKRRLF